MPFRIKNLDDNFFEEGDVSEIDALIEANDEFVLLCAKTIREISLEINKVVSSANNSSKQDQNLK